MKLFNVCRDNICGYFISEDSFKAKQQYIEHFAIPYTSDTWADIMNSLTVKECRISQHGHVDI